MKNVITTRSWSRAGLGGLFVVVAGAALVAAPSASALDTLDLDNLTVSSAGPYGDGQTVTVGGSGLTPGDYTLAVCEFTTYATTVAPAPVPPVKIPACGETTVPVTVSGAGTFSASFTVVTTEANAHANVGGPFGGQPPVVDFAANDGEFVLVPAHGGGFTGAQAADSGEFRVTP